MKITQQILRDKKEHIEKNHGILHCITCREEYTANAADYWAVSDDLFSIKLLLFFIIIGLAILIAFTK